MYVFERTAGGIRMDSGLFSPNGRKFLAVLFTAAICWGIWVLPLKLIATIIFAISFCWVVHELTRVD